MLALKLLPAARGSIPAADIIPWHYGEEKQMRDSLRTGICFGLTSAVITTLGLMVGLHSGTHSRMVILAGILTIAIADAFSDALGIHVSEESDNTRTAQQVWGATIATFLTKCLFALTFAVPVSYTHLTLPTN